MIVDYFLDTNILLYAVDPSPDHPSKHLAAVRLLQSGGLGISGQVLQEFYVNATRKLRQPLTPSEALEFMGDLQRFPCVEIDFSLVAEGIRNSERYQLSYWDGAIVAAAGRLKVPVLYTEDLNHQQWYGSVQAVNPFV